MFNRNLFAALLAVAAVGVKGSPINFGDEIGIAKFCVGKYFQEPCVPYSVGFQECSELYNEFNDSIYSFKGDPNLNCNLYE